MLRRVMIVCLLCGAAILALGTRSASASGWCNCGSGYSGYYAAPAYGYYAPRAYGPCLPTRPVPMAITMRPLMTTTHPPLTATMRLLATGIMRHQVTAMPQARTIDHAPISAAPSIAHERGVGRDTDGVGTVGEAGKGMVGAAADGSRRRTSHLLMVLTVV